MTNKWETGTSITTSILNSSRLGNDGDSMMKENTIKKEKQTNKEKYWCIFQDSLAHTFVYFMVQLFRTWYLLDSLISNIRATMDACTT